MNIVISLLFVLTFNHHNDLAFGAAEYFFKIGEYKTAVVEYERFLFFNPEVSSETRSYVLYKEALCYRNMKRYKRAIDVLNEAIKNSNDPQFVERLKIEKAVTYIGMKKFDVAEAMLLRTYYFGMQQLKRVAALFLGIIYAREGNWRKSLKFIKEFQGDTPELEEFSKKVEKANFKSTKKAKWLSVFLPGAGQIYAGHAFSGIDSFILNGGMLTLMVLTMLNKGIILALPFEIMLFRQFYLGNLHNAQDFVKRHNKKLNEKLFYDLLRSLSNITIVKTQPSN